MQVRRRVPEQVEHTGKAVVRWGLGHALPNTVMHAAARRGDLQGRLIQSSRTGDPFPVFEEIRAKGPLYRGRFAYVTTSLPVVREVLSSNDFRAGFDPGPGAGAIGRIY